jgi:hypothetical protein
MLMARQAARTLQRIRVGRLVEAEIALSVGFR